MRVASRVAHRLAKPAATIGAFALVLLTGLPASAQTLERLKSTGTIRLGYVTEDRPFAFNDDAGAPVGYAVSLCTMIADQVKTNLGLGSLGIEWVPLDPEQRTEAVQGGTVDLSLERGRTTFTLVLPAVAATPEAVPAVT